MWEFAPGSPWKTMRLRVLMGGPVLKSTLARNKRARPGKIRRGVDPEQSGLDDRHVDAHAGLERPQLLEAFAPLERARRQRHEALERGAPIGVEADVMIMRPRPPGRGRAGEIERAQPVFSDWRADHLDHVGISPLALLVDLERNGG